MGNKIMFENPKIISAEELESFKADNPQAPIVDIFDRQCAELAKINNPSGKPEDQPTEVPGESFVYYPWSDQLLRTVGKESLFKIRTNRNRELISAEEQKKLANSVVGVAGMSVGAGIAIGLVYSGISSTLKIADHDDLDTSNLNRLRETLLDVGKPKTHLAAQHVYELDPFSDVRLFNDGVTAENIDSFFSDPDLDVVVDEIDDFKMKVMLRLKAKEFKVPLLMFTSLGDNILIDVERHDTDTDLRIFNGLLHDDGREILNNPNIDQSTIRRYSVEVVGQEYIPTRALQSVSQMGRSLVGRPQLYSTIAIDGGLAAFTIRRLILKGDIKSGRYFLKMTDIYKLNDDDLSDSDERTEILKKMFSNV